MRNLSIFFLSHLLLLSIVGKGQTTYPLWNGIQSGEYNVGFKVIEYLDDSRKMNSPEDDIDNKNPNRFFPIQIAIWYPTSKKWSIDSSLKFKDYFDLTAQKNDFKKLSEEQRNNSMEIIFNFAEYGAKRALNSDEKKQLEREATAALLNPPSINQKFPVILAGHDGGVWKMSTLSEYLASHGYIVISTGPISETFRILREDPQIALNRRIRTFEIVRGMLDEFEFIDDKRIGLLGLNFDGMSTILYQMKNQQADVVVNIDGWDGKNNGYEYVTESIYYKPEKFHTSFLEFQQHEYPENNSLRLTTQILDSLSNSNRFSVIIQDFGHAYLTGNLIGLPNSSENIKVKHDLWYTLIKEFFDIHLKHDENEYSSFWQKVNDNDLLFKKQQKRKEK